MTGGLPSVLVTDGQTRAALAVVRSLGRAGYRVVVCGPRRATLAAASKYAAASVAIPDALSDPHGFVAAVGDCARAQGVRVVLPIVDASLLAVLGNRQAFGDLVVPFPALEPWHAVADKKGIMDAAAADGIATPASVTLAGPGVSDEALRSLPYPNVLKPHRSVVGANGSRTKVGVLHAATAAEARRALAQLPPQAYPVIAQERIVGAGIGVFVLVWEGKLMAAFAHRRLREKPPAGGVSVYRESIPLDQDLLRRSLALLARFHWSGVAMLEFKERARDGTPFLMEVNGRFWGSLQLAIDAGVDFPRLLVEAALGARPTPVTSYDIGVRSRWWWGDVDHLLLRLLRSRATLDLPADSPGRFRALVDFARLRSVDRNEVLRWDDPGPFVRETLDWLQGRSA